MSSEGAALIVAPSSRRERENFIVTDLIVSWRKVILKNGCLESSAESEC